MTVLFSTPSNKSTLSRQARAGRLRRVREGIYTDDLGPRLEDVVRNHLWTIVAHYWPGAVVTDRSAFDGRDRDGWLFLAHPAPLRKQDLVLPGVSVAVRVGAGPLPGDMEYPGGLWRAGNARALLENAHGRRAGRLPKDRPPRALSRVELEEQVDALARQLGDDGLRRVLDEVELLARQLDAEDALPTVRALVVAALGSADAQLESPRLAARARGVAFDPRRVEMFEKLTEALEGIAPSSRPADPTDVRWRELPFFEAYFSNYIEGTEFTIPEARTIVIDGIDPPGRPADAHDVRGTFEIVANLDDMRETPKNPEQLEALLQRRHAVLMSARPEKRPGEYKQTPNRVGTYTFVDPALLTGTLTRGFELLGRLVHPFHRAVSMMFLVAECHPFLDGNGRIARVMANAELVAGGETRIVIPSVYCNNYLAGLRAISNGTNAGESLFSILDFARRWVSYVDWSTFDRAMTDLQRTNALEDPGVADREGRRLLVP